MKAAAEYNFSFRIYNLSPAINGGTIIIYKDWLDE